MQVRRTQFPYKEPISVDQRPYAPPPTHGKHVVMSTFDLTPQDLLKLNDADLRDLVRRLCEAELASQNLPTSAVLAGGAQEAADGGLDVTVKLNQPLTRPNFIPRPYTGFQVKKHHMPPKACYDEMVYHDKEPKVVLSKLAAANGAYIMATTDNCAEPNRQKRLARMADAVDTLDNHNQLLLDFYGIDRLNQWLSLFPGIQLWVRERIGQSLSGWQSHGRWTIVPSADNDAYITDDLPRLTDITANQTEPLTLTQGLNRFRTLLKNPGEILRLVGLSGTGKTRFVQALFETTVGPNALPPTEAVYADLSDTPIPPPGTMIEQLMAENRRAIVVIDNCPPETHRQLTKKIRATTNPSVSLLTIEYDVADDEPEETHVFRLRTTASSLTVSLLQRRFPSLSDTDAARLDQLSDGNARLALALAKHVSKIDNLSQFSDLDLFKRLFEQRHSEDGHLLQEAQVLSLVYSFRISNDAQDNLQDELQILADLIGHPRRRLLSAVATLKKRQLIQSRGQWHAVLPQALANYLAVQALDSVFLKPVQQCLTIPQNSRLLRSYAHRLGTLPLHPAVISAATTFIHVFKLRERLLENDSEALTLLEFVAPVIEDDVFTLFEDLFDTPNFRPEDKTRLAHLLWHLAYEESHFKKAVQLLLKLSQCTPNAQTSTDLYLSQLFSLFLSGTLATPTYRLSVLTDLIDTDYSPNFEQSLPLIFASALKSDQWSSEIDFSFGSKSRSAGWDLPNGIPDKTTNPLHMWYLGLLDLLASDNLVHRPVFPAVLDVFLDEFSSLWQQNFCCHRLEQLCLFFAKNDAYYPSIFKSVSRSLNSRRFIFPDKKALINRLTTLHKNLQKTDLLSLVHQALDGSLLASIEETDAHNSTPNKIRQLGRTFSGVLPQRIATVEKLLWTNTTTHFAFGAGLSEGNQPPKIILDLLIRSYETIQPHTEPSVLIGFLAGIEQQSAIVAEPLIKTCLNSLSLKPYSVQLLLANDIKAWKISLLLSLASDPEVPVGQFIWLGTTQHQISLTDSDFIQLLRRLSPRQHGSSTVLHLLDRRFRLEGCQNYHASLGLINYAADFALQLLLNYPVNRLRNRNPDNLLYIYRRIIPSLSPDELSVHTETLCQALCRQGADVRDVAPFIQSWLEMSPCVLFDAWEKHAYKFNFIQRLSIFFNSTLCRYSINRVDKNIVTNWCGNAEKRLQLMMRLTTVLVRGKAFETSATAPGLHLSGRILELLAISTDKKTATKLIIQLTQLPNVSWVPHSEAIRIQREACEVLTVSPLKDIRDTAAPLLAQMDVEMQKWQEHESLEELENATFE